MKGVRYLCMLPICRHRAASWLLCWPIKRDQFHGVKIPAMMLPMTDGKTNMESMMQTSPRQARQYASGVVEQQQDSLSNATILLQNLSPDQIRMPPAATKNNQHAPKLISSVGGQ